MVLPDYVSDGIIPPWSGSPEVVVGEPDKVYHGVQGGEVAEGGEEERQAGGNLPGKYNLVWY